MRTLIQVKGTKDCITSKRAFLLFLSKMFTQAGWKDHVILKTPVKVPSPLPAPNVGPARLRALFNYQPNALWHIPIAAHQWSWQLRRKPHRAWQPLHTCAPSPWQAQKTARLPLVMINGFADCCSWPSRHIHNLLLAYSPDVTEGGRRGQHVWVFCLHTMQHKKGFTLILPSHITFCVRCITRPKEKEV